MSSTRRRTAVAVLVAAAAAVLLTGCGVADNVVGLHPVPTEQVGGAPLNEETAGAIVSRVVAQAQAAAAATGSSGDRDRKAVLTGSALAMAEAAVSSRTKVVARDPLATPDVPKVLAIVKGRSWPRTILATTLDAASTTQYLHVLTSASPTSPFVLSASVPMLAGASVPAIGPVPDGVEPVRDGTGLVAAPADILREYAGALAYPKPAAGAHLDLTDVLSTSLRSNAAVVAHDLGKLGTLVQKQQVDGTPTSFRLAGGGALVFGQLTRTDTITAASGAKAVTVPAVVAALLGRKSITRSLAITSVETVVLLVPATGNATVIGGAEQLASAKGS